MSRITTPFNAQSSAAEVIAGVDLTGKRAIVTGAASGIGLETARTLATAGAQVTLAVRNTDTGQRAAANIQATTGRDDVGVTHLDLTDRSTIELDTFGNDEGRTELAASRARVVAASDLARRRIERDLHDGAQQRLVSLGLELRLVHDSVPAAFPELRDAIARVADELNDVLDGLRQLCRGIHPAILSQGGLGPALRTLARRTPIPVELDAPTEARFPEPVEVAAYYVVSEALTNAAKYARASHVSITARERDGVLHFSVGDDGVGGADPGRGSGLTGLRDRMEALGGSLDVRSPAGDGTLIRATLPVQPG